MRSGRRVALLACYPLRDPAMPTQFISNHGSRMVEASIRASGLEELEIEVWDLLEADLEAVVYEVLKYDPDVIGFSTYLWSFPFFVEVAHQIKVDDPERLIVFGGPCARPSMFELEPYRTAHEFIDVLVINEGEVTFKNIVESRQRDLGTIKQINGIAYYENDGWVETTEQPLSDLNELPSPYQMDLVPPDGIGVLQTYRGCPFTCSFCEWGVLASPKRVCEVEQLCAELEALDRNDVNGILLVDAGLNLNKQAFANLSQAAKETGFFKNHFLISEIYPAKVTEEHIGFLSDVAMPLIGVGLQSFDHEVLSNVDRNYDEKRFNQTLSELRAVGKVAVEIILGLPGDSPEKFRKNFQRARELRCTLRVYYCVVLPSALMIKAPESYELNFDPYSLKMRSCLGWTEQGLKAEADFVTQQAEIQGGHTGEYFWVFPAY